MDRQRLRQTDYQRGYRAGVVAAAQFVAIAFDEPGLADEIRQYVAPSRNWRKRWTAEMVAWTAEVVALRRDRDG